MNKKLLGIMFGMFLILLVAPMVSAGFWDFLNNKDAVNVTEDKIQIGDRTLNKSQVVDKYSIVNINGWFGLGNSQFSGAITNHTEKCSDCHSDLEIYLNSQDVLIEDIRFEGDEPDNFRIMVQDGTKQVVDGYEY
ncbi:MAG TPA: hypothetical protein VJ912_00085, partial [Candidatus Nanoarchaeia archaeon]|nr:hypothetical protein [Candidatus Nanoarchaeia archaeon]